MKTEFTEAQQTHVSVMKSVVSKLVDLPIVLKGGTALLLAYGLDRFSEDLDFDADLKLNIQARLNNLLKQCVDSYHLDIVKDTNTVQRLRIIYEKNNISLRLKVEISYRQTFSDEDFLIYQSNGYFYKIFKIHKLIKQKINALQGRTRARDLYDLNFLVHNYLNDFPVDSLIILLNRISDIDTLEEEYKLAFVDDEVLEEVDLTNILLSLDTKRNEILQTIQMLS